MTAPLPVSPDQPLVMDGTGMLCVVLLLHLRARIADDPAAPLDLAAWCHLTGHTYLGPLPTAEGGPAYSFTVTGTAKPTHPMSPWRWCESESAAPER
jgi:tRNA 2-thiouridine synthesizing protein A